MIALGFVIGLLLIGALAVHPALAGFALMLSPLVVVELVMMRRSRSRVKIPDYRPQPPVEIELDRRVDES